jgi:hypothetical protein
MATRARQRQAAVSSQDAISSWLDLARLIETLARQRTNCIFRGEPSTINELRPAAGHEGSSPESALTLKYDLMHEREALARLRYNAQPYVGHSSYTDLEWLAILWHHGMATRLFDCTESLFVAALLCRGTRQSRRQRIDLGRVGAAGAESQGAARSVRDRRGVDLSLPPSTRGSPRNEASLRSIRIPCNHSNIRDCATGPSPAPSVPTCGSSWMLAKSIMRRCSPICRV